MYQAFYELQELPFELTSDPRYLFMTKGHREALSNLEYGLFSAKPLTLLLGEAGTGKTTLIQAALESERCQYVSCVYLNNPALTRDEFIDMLATRFDLGADATRSKSVLLTRLESFLRQRAAAGEITALVVDEAQRLGTDLLEEIRLLANMETRAGKLLPLILAGQPELSDRLDEPSMRQLKQRVALRCKIAPLEIGETSAYIASRIRTAGGTPSRILTQQAVMLVHEFSGGVPRTINVICDNALMSGFALNRRLIDAAMIWDVCRDFALDTPSEPYRAPRRPDDRPMGVPDQERQTRAVDRTAPYVRVAAQRGV